MNTLESPEILTTTEFLARVYEAAPRVAVFDCDGTLWGPDSGSAFMYWTMEMGLLSSEATAWLNERYAGYKRGDVSELAICGEMVQVYRGIPEEKLRTAAADWASQMPVGSVKSMVGHPTRQPPGPLGRFCRRLPIRVSILVIATARSLARVLFERRFPAHVGSKSEERGAGNLCIGMSGSQGLRREPNRVKIVDALERALATFALQAPNDRPKRRSEKPNVS